MNCVIKDVWLVCAARRKTGDGRTMEGGQRDGDTAQRRCVSSFGVDMLLIFWVSTLCEKSKRRGKKGRGGMGGENRRGGEGKTTEEGEQERGVDSKRVKRQLSVLISQLQIPNLTRWLP